MPAERTPKVVRSYRLVFRRRWRIFRLQGWRIPLPNGLELRALGYWLCALAAILALGRLPLAGGLVATLPQSLRLVALPIAAAWALSRWEVDGRSPHRALIGVAAWWLRPRTLASGRRCPAEGSVLAPLGRLLAAPDLRGCAYPRGRLRGPTRLLLRYPVRVGLQRVPRRAGGSSAARMAAARRWRISRTGGPALHRGKTLEVPPGRTVIFD